MPPGVTETLFAPVQSTTAFEETLERLSTAIKLGLLEPGARLPAERELCEQLSIARSTLRQALTALVQSGHLVAIRGRGGGTFVAASPPAPEPPSVEVLAGWRDTCDTRLAIELGATMLAAERAEREQVERLDEHVATMAAALEDSAAYRHADVLFHIGLAEAADSPTLVAAMTEAQSAMSDLVAHMPHPPELLGRSNAQHARVVDCLERRDPTLAVRIMGDHLRGTEHVLSGWLPPQTVTVVH
jgi:GntR family transcriptional regulator, transcriptional repressor for pyruvate dehydrogenase complex